jgi:AraC-like DNA-binding protein
MAEGLPRLLYGGADEVADATYHWPGALRDPWPRVVFQFTVGGRGVLEGPQGRMEVRAGMAFCHNLGDPGYSYFYPEDGRDAWSFVYCVFVGFTDAINHLVAERGPVFRLGSHSLAVQRLRKLLESQTSHAPLLEASQHFGMCVAIVDELIHASENTGVEGKGEALVRRAEELIRTRVGSTFALAGIAGALQVTPEHLCRAFRNHRGITPKGYHDELRLGQACERLLNSSAAIKEIAVDAGFSDVSHFGKFFKARRGVTPGEFRRHAAFRHW